MEENKPSIFTDQNNFDILNFNPGEKLKEELVLVCSTDSPLNRSSFFERMDALFLEEGELLSLMYDSCINYAIRRLIVSASHLNEAVKSNIPNDDAFEGMLLDALRGFVKESTAFPSNQSERVVVLLRECIRAKENKDVSRGTKNQILKEGMSNGDYCYICGGEISYTDTTSQDAPEIEHLWPHSMGGSSNSFNLKISCSKCNKLKRSYINASDFHYEQICFHEDLEALEEAEQEANTERQALQSQVSPHVIQTEGEVVESIARGDDLKDVINIYTERVSGLVRSFVETKMKSVFIDDNVPRNEHNRIFRRVTKRDLKLIERFLIEIIREKPENLNTELRKEYKIALWSKNGYKCILCDSDEGYAQKVGRLKFRRQKLDDIWHFLNIDTYCDKHAEQIRELE